MIELSAERAAESEQRERSVMAQDRDFMVLGYALEALWGTLFGPDNTKYYERGIEERESRVAACVARFEKLEPPPIQC